MIDGRATTPWTLVSGPAPPDTVRFLNRGTRGNRVEIVKRLPFAHIQAYMAGGQAAPVTPPPSTTSPSTAATAPVTVRVMTPDDAIAVARCTYAVYGYTLPDDYLYFPDRMCEMLRGGSSTPRHITGRCTSVSTSTERSAAT